MFRSPRATQVPLAQLLVTLPAEARAFELDDAWLVVSPQGLFVLTEDDGDLAAACTRAAQRADALRLELSDHLAWVPFIDAMCATYDPHFDPDQPCLVVPQDLVVHTVGTGPVRVDEATLESLAGLRYPIVR